MTGRWFSFSRLWAMIVKEFIQMRRDRLTFAMILGIPVMQLILFGFAINSDPKHLPTALNVQDPSVFSRRIVGWAMESHLRTELILAALNMALQQRRPDGGLHVVSKSLQVQPTAAAVSVPTGEMRLIDIASVATRGSEAYKNSKLPVMQLN